jgi:hypothetical protein
LNDDALDLFRRSHQQVSVSPVPAENQPASEALACAPVQVIRIRFTTSSLPIGPPYRQQGSVRSEQAANDRIGLDEFLKSTAERRFLQIELR